MSENLDTRRRVHSVTEGNRVAFGLGNLRVQTII